MNKHLLRLAAASIVTVSLGISAFAAPHGVMQTTPPSSSLPAGTLIYYEDFQNVKGDDTDSALAALKWTKSTGLRDFTAQLKIEDGHLVIDNLDETVGESQDSYMLIMDDAWLGEFVKGDYTYQYDATYIAAENTYRYDSLLCNYDGVDNYNTVDIRIRGDGYNQVRRGGDWIHYSDDEMPMGDTSEDGMAAKVFGIEFDDAEYSLAGVTFTVRVEMLKDKGPRVYVNGVFVSEMDENEDQWGDIPHSAIAFKSSTKLLSYVDNIMIWAGSGVEPDMSAIIEEETAAPETAAPEAAPAETSAPAAAAPAAPAAPIETAAPVAAVTAAPVQTAAPQTGDAVSAVILAAVASLGTAFVISKRK